VWARESLTIGVRHRDVWRGSFGSFGVGGKRGDMKGSMRKIDFLLKPVFNDIDITPGRLRGKTTLTDGIATRTSRREVGNRMNRERRSMAIGKRSSTSKRGRKGKHGGTRCLCRRWRNRGKRRAGRIDRRKMSKSGKGSSRNRRGRQRRKRSHGHGRGIGRPRRRIGHRRMRRDGRRRGKRWDRNVRRRDNHGRWVVSLLKEVNP
jgi:hypothetical protein